MLTRRLKRAAALFAIFVALLALVFIGDLWLDFLSPSLQNRLPLHPATPVLADIKICTTSVFESCNPSSGWVRIEKDLLLSQSWLKKKYLMLKYIPEPLLEPGQKVITALDAGPQTATSAEFASRAKMPAFVTASFTDQSVDLQSSGWVVIDEDLRLWAQYLRHIPGKAVTNVKILFGDDVKYPLPEWQISEHGLGLQPELGARLAFKIGRPLEITRPQLKARVDGTFKIAQLSDLHMSTTHGVCSFISELLPQQSECRADLLTSNFVNRVLDLEQPDLAVFSGDLIFGQQCLDSETALLKAVGPAIERQIPFAIIWGNHDKDGNLQNHELMQIASELPFFVGEEGPEEAKGSGNYVLHATHQNYPAISMYFIDTHAKIGKTRMYESVDETQNEFLKQEIAKSQAKQQNYPHIPLGLAFVHVPLPEYRSEMPILGEKREGVIASAQDTGTFNILKQGVQIITAGHDHANSFCGLYDHMWLCYAGGMGYGGYGGYPDENGNVYRRRARMFDLDMNTGTVNSWHRIDGVNDIEVFKLVDNGIVNE